jgi:hypothetical protein
MTRLARRWIATHLLTNSAAIRSSACGAQLGQARPLGHGNCKPTTYPPNGPMIIHRM